MFLQLGEGNSPLVEFRRRFILVGIEFVRTSGVELLGSGRCVHLVAHEHKGQLWVLILKETDSVTVLHGEKPHMKLNTE